MNHVIETRVSKTEENSNSANLQISHQIFLLLCFQREIRRARLHRGVLGAGEPQPDAAAGNHQEESSGTDHGAENQTEGV